MHDAIVEEPRMAELKRRLVTLYDVYNAKLLRKSCLSIRGGAGVIERILGEGKYRHALEIGTFRGVGAAALSLYCERVTTIDLKHGQLEVMGEPFDRYALWEQLGRNNIDLHLVEDNAEKAEIVNALDFDIAFIDGAHQTAGVTFDFNLVKRCGTVLFHDYDRRGGPGQDDVANFVDSLPKAQVQAMDIFALWTAP